MADIVRTATATWQGDLKSGFGTTSTPSGALHEVKITASARFEGAPGANPEELLASAEAACFSMALSANLGRAGFTPTAVNTKATLTMTRTDAGFRIIKLHLDTEATVPGIESARFAEIAETTKEGCPVSALLKPGLQSLTLSAKLVG
ncbi:MAG TPA: OsmC family peroxiredoxin [Anaerolineae bacterium]|nr:OsmC family peroxiredoxin [Anaerolineae bacterium]